LGFLVENKPSGNPGLDGSLSRGKLAGSRYCKEVDSEKNKNNYLGYIMHLYKHYYVFYET
jgi:hypothetical protein